MPALLGAEGKVVNQMGEIPCPCGAYILVVETSTKE